MPDNIEQPGQAPEVGVPAKKRTRKATAKVSGEQSLAAILKKYRIDRETKINAEDYGTKRPLGLGPVVDPAVIAKLTEIDKTPTKSYVDWILWQAGGGGELFKKSLDHWGVGHQEVTPEAYIQKFESTNSVLSQGVITKLAKDQAVSGLENIAYELIQATKKPDVADRFDSLVAVLKQNNVAAGNEGKLAMLLLTAKLKAWLKGDNIPIYELKDFKDNKTSKMRDRVHTVAVLTKLMRRIPREQAEAAWLETEPGKRYEYTVGDQDALKWNMWGLCRYWHGAGPDDKIHAYGRPYEAVVEFIKNKQMLEQRLEKIKEQNARIEASNKGQPAEMQRPLREIPDIALDIGTITLTNDLMLVYKGEYPSVGYLVEANEEMSDLPLRDIISNDVRYAGPEGRKSRGEKLYSDENLDVQVPLTMAASIKAGHPSWAVSNPAQLSGIRSRGNYSMSAWTQAHAGLDFMGGDAQAGNQPFRRVHVMFTIKLPVPQGTEKVLMVTGIDAIVKSKLPSNDALYRIGGGQDVSFKELVAEWKSTLDPKMYSALMRSFVKAFKAIRDWGSTFSPRSYVADPIKHYRDYMGSRQGLQRGIEERAHHVVEALLA